MNYTKFENFILFKTVQKINPFSYEETKYYTKKAQPLLLLNRQSKVTLTYQQLSFKPIFSSLSIYRQSFIAKNKGS